MFDHLAIWEDTFLKDEASLPVSDAFFSSSGTWRGCCPEASPYIASGVSATNCCSTSDSTCDGFTLPSEAPAKKKKKNDYTYCPPILTYG